MERFLFVLSGALGFVAVALGAFGAHTLKSHWAQLADGAARLDWWNTAAHYQAIHALALALAAFLAGRTGSLAASVAGLSFGLGAILFSGSLYALALTGLRPLGAITPLGGLLFLVGWGGVVLSAWQLPR